jgi:phage regulator Rha-like protein
MEQYVFQGGQGKRHDNVTADIRNMLSVLDLSTADFSAVYKAGNGQQYEHYELPRDLTETLITGYSIPLLHKVVVRLRELEAEVAKPQFTASTTFLGALITRHKKL